MMQVQLDDLYLTVDEETANNLRDPQYAQQYLHAVRTQLLESESQTQTGPSTSSGSQFVNQGNIENQTKSCQLWKSAKAQTTQDHEATIKLLQLRKELDNEFQNKKTHKNELWTRISKQMNASGFFVGDGIEGREKVRQKLSNLYNSFLKYNEAQKRTGEGKLKVPKYYEELNDIFGDKHKANPVIIMDSTDEEVEPKSGTSRESIPLPSTETSSETSPAPHRFHNIKKRVKPPTAKKAALEELVKIQKENQIQRKEEFNVMIELFKTESTQRHEQMMTLISHLTNKKEERKKRRRDSSESD